MRLFGLLAVLVTLAAVGIFFLNAGPKTSLAIISGSENEALEPIITDWGKKNGVAVTFAYKGSVDISRELSKGAASGYDAVWPANSLWIELGDSQKVVKHEASVLRSPVVLGLKTSIAERLGWIGRDDLTIQDIQAAARDGAFRLAMTSATQSNSGASAYFGFLYALAGSPDVLTMDHLSDPAVLDGVRDLLSQLDRSSGSSGWLKSSLVASPRTYDAMFNYEAMIIEANQALTARGEDPLYLIYPANGLSVADSPLGLIDKGDATKEDAFIALMKHLQGAESQALLSALGRRAGLIGLSADQADTAIWNPGWGIDLNRNIAPIPTPDADVIREALLLYQTELRKPSLTVWVLDVSGSMEGPPLGQLKDAMGLLLDKEAAAVSLLQPSNRDVTIILPFNNKPFAPEIIHGAGDAELARALRKVNGLNAGGGTDLYLALDAAFKALASFSEDGTLFDYLPAVVAMTDGASEVNNRPEFLRRLKTFGFAADIPIHAIAFGNADEAQLDELSRTTVGRLFEAGDDLAGALRKAKGYN